MNPPPSSNPPKRVAIVIELSYSQPWHQDCYQGIAAYGQEHNWTCVADPFLIGPALGVGAESYDGAVGRINADTLEIARRLRLPIVNHFQSFFHPDLPSVCVDVVSASRRVAEHLIQSGYQRFGYLGIRDYPERKILDSFAQAITDRGYHSPACCYTLAHFEASPQTALETRDLIYDWLKQMQTPVGVLVRHVSMGRYLAQACRELGLRVPHDVAIVLGDSDPTIVTNASPTLSSVQFDLVAVGYQAAAMLDQLMQGRPASPMHQVVEAKHLAIRESSDVFLCPDPLVSDAMRFIAAHREQPLRVEDLADALYTSRRTLERRFEEVLGRSVYHEIARLRTDLIKDHLVNSDQSLAVIANQCGFSSPSHFTRFFRKQVGMTPGSYRRQYRQG